MFGVWIRTAGLLFGGALLIWLVRPIFEDLREMSIEFASAESPIPTWIGLIGDWLPVLLILSAIMLTTGAAVARRGGVRA